MSRILTAAEVLDVRARLRRGERHAAIARALDLSHWTIARIADEPPPQPDELSGEELPVDNGPADFSACQLRRCPGCGAMVYRWPCLACRMINSPSMAEFDDEDDDLDESDELMELLDQAARS